MCRRLIFLTCLVFVLSMAGNASADLIGHWRFDEGSGDTAADTSGNGYNGTLNGGPSWVPGKSLGALEFDGTDDYVGTGQSLLDNMSEFSLALWVSARNPSASRIGLVGQNDLIEMGFMNGNAEVWTSATGTTTTPWPFSNDTWHHIAVVADGTNMNIYLDGELAISGGASTVNFGTSGFSVNIGGGGVWDASGNWFSGQIDDVRIYDHALSEVEISETMETKPWPYALNPVPADGALYPDTWVSLTWTSGGYAASHNVYMGTSFDDVNEGTGDTFLATVPENYVTKPYVIVGIIGFPLPEGLVPGTTYYWRVDEVNDLDPNSPWKGDVWSFRLPPKKAYDPSPVDGAKFIDPDVTLSWTPGHLASLHAVYFGDDFDTVDNATGAPGLPFTTFTPPGPLELDKTYYWRVDETDNLLAMHRGDVWSFKTLPDIPIVDPNLMGWWKLDEGMGTTALDWSGHGNHGTLMGDPQWVPGFDGDALELDGTGDHVTIPSIGVNSNTVTMTAWVKRDGDQTGWAAIIFHRTGGRACGFGFSGQGGMTNHLQNHWNDNDAATYNFASGLVVPDNEWTFVAVVVEPSKATLYLNGTTNFAVNSIAHITQDLSGPLLLGVDPTNMARIVRGAIDDARVYDRALTAEEIREAMRGDPLVAWDPIPTNWSTPDIDVAVPLSWSPGDNASQHDVYFGTDETAVEDADASDPTGVYRGRQGATSYTPPEGVEWGGGPYYWRIDEFNSDATISTGRVWRFTVGDFILVDDIEDYDVDNPIWENWLDGLGFVGTDGVLHAGNGSGSEVGDPDTGSYTEESIVHGGGQSMPYWYNNNKPDKMKYSEAKKTLTETRDWTKHDVRALSLWFQGFPASVGSFVESPPGTYTMTGSGADIWDIGPGAGEFHDEFHFAYKMLNGQGSIVARVESVENTNAWAKAGVMIRETLDGGSKHAFACVTPENGVASQGRPDTGAASFNTAQGGITAPHWVRLERDLAGNFTVSHSADGSAWEPVENALPENIQMSSNVHIGLALTSHDAALTCEAVFSNVTITGNVSGQWQHQDIGIQSNAAEPMYVAIANSTGPPAVVYHDDPAAAQIDTWTEWNIDLKEFQDKGVNLTDVNSVAIGFGNRNNPQVGGAGKMFLDDLRLYRGRYIPGMGTPVEADFNSDGIVDNLDLEIMCSNWLDAAVAPSGSPIGWWKFDNNTNDSAGTNHGTANGSPGYTTGMDGQAISFDGVDDYVSVVGVGISGAAPRTIAGWAKADVTEMNDWTNVFGFTGPSGSGGHFDIEHVGNTNSSTHGYYGVHMYGDEYDIMPVDLDWHHLAATYDGTTVYFYGDGGRMGSATYAIDTPDTVNIGKREDNTNFFPGSVDDVRIYDYALSSSEIFSLAEGSPLDLNGDMKIDFKDYALLVDQWLEKQLWPEW
jgi:hypothetical protein